MPTGMVAAPGGGGVVQQQLTAYNPYNPQVRILGNSLPLRKILFSRFTAFRLKLKVAWFPIIYKQLKGLLPLREESYLQHIHHRSTL